MNLKSIWQAASCKKWEGERVEGWSVQVFGTHEAHFRSCREILIQSHRIGWCGENLQSIAIYVIYLPIYVIYLDISESSDISWVL